MDDCGRSIAVMQPYLFPYIGYFQLINAVDKFVIYDDVNYIKKGWINRNNIIINKQKALFTISLAGASQNKLINEIDISDNFEKLLKTIQFSYSKAPYFRQTYEILNKIVSFENRNLSLFITNSLETILDYLNIDTEILLSSNLNKDSGLKGQVKIMSICKELNAETYVNPIGGIDLYDKEYFDTTCYRER
jgi:predicted HNH restriction endonuclease